ncbi:MAG: hypothetical protein HYW01_01595 [Deltaproteobacteria bacterium]|nr:hypothetical protein [Deltaproteobacteria bacterium]
MNTNHKIYFYRGKLPWGFFPVILFGIIIFSILAILGLFVGIVIGAIATGFMLLRLLFPSKKDETKRFEEDGRTVVLREDEYEVIEKNRQTKIDRAS